METIEELTDFVSRLSKNAGLQQLLDAAEDLALLRQVHPETMSPRGIDVDTDLARTGFSYLRAALALREKDATKDTTHVVFSKAARAFHCLVTNCAHDRPEIGFWSVMGASAYHLSGYSATAYSLISQRDEDSNFAPAERVIIHLILRDLQSLRTDSKKWLHNATDEPASLIETVDDGVDIYELISSILTTTAYRAFAYFEFALATGNHAQHHTAVRLLTTSLSIAERSGCVTFWWIIRVAIHLIDDLWMTSLHQTLPTKGPISSPDYADLRRRFLALLYSRRVAEIELWPSQFEAAQRAVDISDDLVVSLPTSSGKTRIAEICALMTLSQNKRVLILTPLRALSLQMERSFRLTFEPLGFSVSSLYSLDRIGINDSHPFRRHEIVVSTPEKLDFALKLDQSLLDDIGLIVLDEGHMIGQDERELRFELLIQRLLRREDARDRRIVCLSAILPDDETLADFNAWIRKDTDGSPIRSNWRPTKTKYATINWKGESAELAFTQSNGPVVHGKFIKNISAIPPRRKSFPKDNRELTLASAWRFVLGNKRVMIYCTQRNSTDQYAKEIVSLVHRGFLQAFEPDEMVISNAKQIAIEWLGNDHVVVKCLEIGVAIHHAGLPRAFLQELQKVLFNGDIKLIVTSPTLAQGLNIGASVVIFPTLYRAGQLLDSSEFINVVGRVGRALVDTEGLAVHTIYNRHLWRSRTWRSLVRSNKLPDLQSGLIQLLSVAMKGLAATGRLREHDAFEYLANNRDAWRLPSDDGQASYQDLLHRLDLAILNLLDALDADSDTLASAIDGALLGSLWSRQIDRFEEDGGSAQRKLLVARARLIWSHTECHSRRVYFVMGVGLESGLFIDSLIDKLIEALDEANQASLSGDVRSLHSGLTRIGGHLLKINPFVPNTPWRDDWADILHGWLAGNPISDIGSDKVPFIQEAFVHRLTWALQSLSVCCKLRDLDSDHPSGTAIACLETGLPRFDMAMLVKAGLPSRQAAFFAMSGLDPNELAHYDLRSWLNVPQVYGLDNPEDWPSPAWFRLWRQFLEKVRGRSDTVWRHWSRTVHIRECELVRSPKAGEEFRVEYNPEAACTCIYTPDYKIVAKTDLNEGPWLKGICTARFDPRMSQFVVSGVGPS